jgi:hypothetical protein
MKYFKMAGRKKPTAVRANWLEVSDLNHSAKEAPPVDLVNILQIRRILLNLL